ncbi:Sugar transporter ERD6-like 4 [Vitis vinifera]|uniref:Sugar transporter ERD6-like 4 n=1 Tax=Vitis vinifera TaxID=29760 RepID=A0A438K4H7_VITVI|nr:Sugar transporter ERD6-like 4 [Vitis vinifera]
MAIRDEFQGRERGWEGFAKPFLHTGNWYRKGSRQSNMMRSSQVIRDSSVSIITCVLINNPGMRTLKREKKNLKREKKTRKDRKQIFIGGG